MKRLFSIIAFCAGLILYSPYLDAQRNQHPNVLILYTDDLGYGDLSCYGAKASATPNIDWLAENGLRFTDAHCTASTCTPSRYSILLGQYAWRKKGTNILPGDANLTIPTNITTLPKVFQRAGYLTGAVGKWHLGLGNTSPIDWNKKVTPGPAEIGFDYSFIFPATADRTPNVFMENQIIVGLDTSDPIEVNYHNPYPAELLGRDHPELLKMKSDPNQGHDGHIANGIGRIGFMKGGKHAEWTDEELGYTFNSKAIEFIDNSLKAKKPFFLYYAIHDIHVPRMPATIFKGKSKLGYRGDAILEMDHTVGVILNALKERGLLNNTLIIFSSDNGPVLNDGYLDQSPETALREDYKASGIYRGGKYSVLEGGTRIPFIVYWAGEIKPHTVSNSLFSQVDLMASFAGMLKEKLSANEFTDSRNYFTTLTGKQSLSRDYIVEQPSNTALAIVKDGWKYITPSNGPALMKEVNIETGYSKEDQLYDLKNDPQEAHNLARQNPQKLEELKLLLDKIKAEN
ncbi:MAG TPA: arylsulfatase [Hanamia sp.]|nr:arylsulfatase [Hanamia sp.]